MFLTPKNIEKLAKEHNVLPSITLLVLGLWASSYDYCCSNYGSQHPTKIMYELPFSKRDDQFDNLILYRAQMVQYVIYRNLNYKFKFYCINGCTGVATGKSLSPSSLINKKEPI